MYVTRPLSLLRRHPELLTLPPQEGPNSGYLVLFDEECETTTCFGLCKDRSIRSLPFPQNKNLTIFYSVGDYSYYDNVIFILVLDQPFCSDTYYVIQRQGKHKENGCAVALKSKENKLKEMKDEVFDERDELAMANIYLAPDEFMLLAEESCRKTNSGGSSSDAFMARSRFREREMMGVKIKMDLIQEAKEKESIGLTERRVI
ncbi:hypothetical protein PanWU01x14_266130 [Parasponia andersonii]|uniref:Uncharacterized protein n=1 Tax=Parasponia andersonii TaxID=3476 RepID=A0A2P5B6Z4_PARAD|nr:hypothetical protein PanWU01x14_266130 [Parasponia andersonii]